MQCLFIEKTSVLFLLELKVYLNLSNVVIVFRLFQTRFSNPLVECEHCKSWLSTSSQAGFLWGESGSYFYVWGSLRGEDDAKGLTRLPTCKLCLQPFAFSHSAPRYVFVSIFLALQVRYYPRRAYSVFSLCVLLHCLTRQKPASLLLK